MMTVHIPLLLLSSLLPSFVTCQYSINIYPQILSKNNRSYFEPDRWNGHNGLDQQKFIAGNLAIGSRPARWNNPDGAYFRQAPEDPNRRGYPDPNFFRNKTFQAKLNSLYLQDMQGYGPNNTLALLTWGKFWPSWMNTSQHGGLVPNNLDAGAEMILLLLEAVYNYTGGLPEYYEVNNEPDAFGPSVTWDTVIQYEKAVAQKLHGRFPLLKVIGPSKDGEIQLSDEHDFKIWGRVRDYLDMSLYNLDEFSFHPYDFFHSQNGQHFFTGSNEARLIAFIDLVESYAFMKTGKHVPLVTTEYGLSRRYVDPATTAEMVQWAYAYLHNAFMFTYLNERGVFDKAVAFLLSYSFEPFLNASIFYPNGTETHVAKAYRFWNNLDDSQQFLRVDGSFDGKERTISPLALYSKSNNNVTVLLHNYQQSSATVALNFDSAWTTPTSVKSTCFYLDSTGIPVLQTDNSVPIQDKIVSLKPESSCLFTFHTDYDFQSVPTFNEETVYAKDIVIPIVGGSIQTTATVSNVEKIVSVVMRVAVSNANKTVQTSPTGIEINKVPCPTSNVFWFYGRDEDTTDSQWKVYNYDIPVKALVSGENTISSQFAQSGGYVSSVALIAGVIS